MSQTSIYYLCFILSNYKKKNEEIIKARYQSNEIESKKTKKNMSGIKNVWFFKNINKINNLLARLTKKGKTQMCTNIRHEHRISLQTLQT